MLGRKTARTFMPIFHMGQYSAPGVQEILIAALDGQRIFPLSWKR
jgi:hypothetical protein